MVFFLEEGGTRGRIDSQDFKETPGFWSISMDEAAPHEEVVLATREYIRNRATQEKLGKEDVAFLESLIAAESGLRENKRRIDDEIEVIKGEHLKNVLKPRQKKQPRARSLRLKEGVNKNVLLIMILVGTFGFGIYLGNTVLAQHPSALVASSNDVFVAMPPGAGNNVSTPATMGTLLGYGYQPDVLRVVIGVNNTVTWINEDKETTLGFQISVPHTVTSPDGMLNSGIMNAGDRFTYIFTSPGTYYYHCVYHPWMKGEVVVVAAAGASSST